MNLHPLADHAEALAASGGDPWLRFAVDPGRRFRAWASGDGRVVAVSRRRPHAAEEDLVVLPTDDADPADVVSAVRTLPGLAGARSLTVPAAWDPVVAGVLGSPGTGWEWRWTEQAPPHQPGEADVVPLDPETDPALREELTGLLLAHSPRHSARPGDPGVRGWAGVSRDGLVVAAAAWFEPAPRVPLLASVVVAPRARRQGLGAALTVAIARRALAGGARAVAVDLYADNDPARRLYERLGFRRAHAFVSRGVG